MPPYNSTALANLIVQGGQRRGQQAGATRRALGQFVGGLGQQASQLTGQIMQERREGPLRKQMALSSLLKQQLDLEATQQQIDASKQSVNASIKNVELAEAREQRDRDQFEWTRDEQARTRAGSETIHMSTMGAEDQEKAWPQLLEHLERAGVDMQSVPVSPTFGSGKFSQWLESQGRKLDPSLRYTSIAQALANTPRGTDRWNELYEDYRKLQGPKQPSGPIAGYTIDATGEMQEGYRYARYDADGNAQMCAQAGDCIAMDDWYPLMPATDRSFAEMKPWLNLTARQMVDKNLRQDASAMSRQPVVRAYINAVANKYSIAKGLGPYDANMAELQFNAVKTLTTTLNNSDWQSMFARVNTLKYQMDIVRTTLRELEEDGKVRSDWSVINRIMQEGARSTPLKFGYTEEVRNKLVKAQTVAVTAMESLAATITGDRAITSDAWDMARKQITEGMPTSQFLAAMNALEIDINQRLKALGEVAPTIPDLCYEDQGKTVGCGANFVQSLPGFSEWLRSNRQDPSMAQIEIFGLSWDTRPLDEEIKAGLYEPLPTAPPATLTQTQQELARPGGISTARPGSQIAEAVASRPKLGTTRWAREVQVSPGVWEMELDCQQGSEGCMQFEWTSYTQEGTNLEKQTWMPVNPGPGQ